MELQIGKWGNSLALRLPASVARRFNWHEGSKVELRLEGGHELRISPNAAASGTQRQRAALARQLLAQHQGKAIEPSVVTGMRDDE